MVFLGALSYRTLLEATKKKMHRKVVQKYLYFTEKERGRVGWREKDRHRREGKEVGADEKSQTRPDKAR